MSTLRLRNVRVGGRRTSVRLEPELWEALDELCALEAKTVDEICHSIVGGGSPRGLTSRLRVFIVDYFRARGGPARGKRPRPGQRS